MSKKIVILYSGGLDSFVLYHWAKSKYPNDDVVPIYWNYHHTVSEEEIRALPDFVQIRNVDWMNIPGCEPKELPGRTEGPIFVAGRNLVFSVLNACMDLPDEIWLGTLDGETSNKGTDKNYQFLWTLNTTLNYVLSPFYGENKVTVKFPFADAGMNKLDIVRWALDNNITSKELISTYSCHYPEGPCGKCVQCVKRYFIFLEFGISEDYKNYPPESVIGNEMIANYLNNIYYNQRSRDELGPGIIKYLSV